MTANVVGTYDKLDGKDLKNGATYIPNWVTLARRNGDRVRMVEMEYWINYTNKVHNNQKFSKDEWSQVKVFKLPKKTLKLQIEPEHLDVFLAVTELIKPRKNCFKYVYITIKLKDRKIIQLDHIYGIFDDSNLNKNFELKKENIHKDILEYKFKKTYDICVHKY